MNLWKINRPLLIAALAAGSCMFGRPLAVAGVLSATKETCVTASCHAAMGKLKFVHGPVAVGDCTACHSMTAQHAFQTIKDVNKLCATCHPKPDLSASHALHKQAICTTCHDPHQSDNTFQLRTIPRKSKK